MGPFGKRNALASVMEGPGAAVRPVTTDAQGNTIWEDAQGRVTSAPGQAGAGYTATQTGRAVPNYLGDIIKANQAPAGSRLKAMSGGGNATEWWGDNQYKTPEHVYIGDPTTHSSGSADNQIPDNFLTPNKRAPTSYWTPEVMAGRMSLLNGKPYEILDAQGNVIGTDVFRNLSDADSMDNVAIAMMSMGFGAALAGAGAAATAGGAGSGAGAGGAGYGIIGGATEPVASLSTAGFGSAAGAGGAGAAGYGAFGATEPVASLSLGGGGAGYGAIGGAVEPVASLSTASGGSSIPGLGSLLKSGASKMAGEFSWTDLIGPALNLAGGAMGAEAAEDASHAQLQAAREAAARFEPWRQVGAWGIGQAGTMLGKDGAEAARAAFAADPGYQHRLAQGENALTRMASARGGLGSGKFLKDAIRFNQGEASQEFGNSLNRLLAISGMGQTATGSSADYLTQGANAQAAGTVGAANAWGNALTQGYGMYQNNQQQRQNTAFQNALLAKYMGA